jgi:thiol-disulfide isomerase/thioredoxin
MAELQEVSGNSQALLAIPKKHLPGEFILRFNYKEKEGSTPYPSEKHIFLNKQDVELWVHPMFANNSDSTWFGKGEIENTTFARFSKENGKQKEKLTLLQNFLLNYDDPLSAFYRQGITEYEKRRIRYNDWLNQQAEKEKTTFVSRTFSFHFVPPIQWTGTEEERKKSVMEHYFDGASFSDPLITRTADLKEWMNGYVNLYGASATTVALRDSLFTLAGKRAIEKARAGHPEVYGWMVDYFYNGYESFGIAKGMQMLQTYIDDPACLTTKRKAITIRLQGMKSLVPGSVAPDFALQDPGGKGTSFHAYPGSRPYKLVLFWSADCGHCKDLLNTLYPWYKKQGQQTLDVIALSMDQSATEIRSWKTLTERLPGWMHLRPEGGINSREAKDYFILSTPFMVLVDARTNTIVGLPENVNELSALLKP